MMRIAWKPYIGLGFILFLIFSGCGERQPPVDELVVQAEELLDAGQIENAILILEKCQERAPERVDVLEALAFAYAAKGDPMLASMTFLRISELVPQRPEYRLYAAETLLQASDPKGAVAQYAAYLEVRPEDRAVWVTLADLYISQGRLNEALDALLAAEQIEARSQQRIAIGELYLRTGNLAQAQAWFARALEGDSAFRDEALLGLMETAIRSKRFADGEALLAQLDGEYPGRVDQSDLDNVRDQLLEWRRRQDAAREAVAALEAQRPEIVLNEEIPAADRPAEESPADIPAADQPAVIPETAVAEAMGEPAEELDGTTPVDAEATPREPGRVATESYSGTIPADSAAADHLSLARARRNEGSLDQAIRHYKKALILNDNQPQVWAELSEAYLQAGNDRWAQATASEAMRRDPENPKMVLQFIRAAQRTMDSERLLREMEQAYRTFPNQPEIILVLARAYRDVGNLRNARLLYRKFLEVVPADYPARVDVESELRNLGA
jgi:tetratricopeptide (TPR) repeat protein